MDQARFLQRVRMNQFKKVYDRWKQKKLTERGGRLGLSTFYQAKILCSIYLF